MVESAIVNVLIYMFGNNIYLECWLIDFSPELRDGVRRCCEGARNNSLALKISVILILSSASANPAVRTPSLKDVKTSPVDEGFFYPCLS